MKEQLDSILDQQIFISQMSSGINYSDTEQMDEYERQYILHKLFKLKKEEIEAKQRAFDAAKKK